MPANCQARCFVWSPRAVASGRFGIADCTKSIGHHTPHKSDNVTEYDLDNKVVNVLLTEITWYHDDRRTFFGNLVECDDKRCVLPKHSHKSKHAY